MSSNFIRALMQRPQSRAIVAFVRARVTRRSVLVSSLLIVAFVFLRLFDVQNDETNPNIVRERLREEKSTLELPNWTASRLLNCEEETTPREKCALTTKRTYALTLPNRKQIQKLTSHFGRNFNRVVLTHSLTSQEIKDLPDSEELVLVAPRGMHFWIEIRVGAFRLKQLGYGSSLMFPIPAKELIQGKTIEMEIDFGENPLFGPMETPPALVHPYHVEHYATFHILQSVSSNLMIQLDVSLRLLLAGTALLLDHSNTFFILSLYGTVRALRAYTTGFEYSALRDFTFFTLSGIVFAVLLIFLLEIARFHELRRKLTVPLLALGVGYGIIGFALGIDNRKADLLPDVISSFIGMLIVTVSILRHMKRHAATHQNSRAETPEELRNLKVAIFRDVILLAALFLNAWGNFSDYATLGKEQYKNILDWRQSLLIPALIIAAMVEVGSVVKLIDRYTREAKKRALLERDVEIATDVQKLILPPMNGEFSGGKWKALHYPTGPLAGDWFDCQELRFGMGRRVLAFCVVDVMGKGIGASLLVSAISATWRTWCDEFVQRISSPDGIMLESGLRDVTTRIHKALQSLKTLKGCTGLFGLLDTNERSLRYISIGHPSPIVVDMAGIEGLPLPDKGYLGVWDAPHNLKIQVREIQPGSLVMLFTDGVVPRGEATADWILDLEDKFANRPKDAPREVARQVQKNRAIFRDDPTVADDMTLVMLYLSRSGESGQTLEQGIG